MAERPIVVVGPVVILSGPALRSVVGMCSIAARSRSVSGMPRSAITSAIAQACADALSASGQSDVRETQVTQHVQQQQRTMTITAAAQILRLSERQTRRLATRLGGKLIGGRWLLDEDAVREHATEGK